MVSASVFKKSNVKIPLENVERHPLAGEHFSHYAVQHDSEKDLKKLVRNIFFFLASLWCLAFICQFLASHYDWKKEHGSRTSMNGFQDIAKEYIGYIEEYNKTYPTSQESLKRLNAYYSTSEKIDDWNKAQEHGSAHYGHNDLSDWTDAEFEKTLLPMSFYQRLHKEAEFIQPIPDSLAAMKGERSSPYPDFFDWRDRNVVTPVKAQGQCGSCWAFASTATVEAAYAIAHGERRNLSEQTLLDCDLVDNACDGGDEDKAFRYIHRNGLANAVDLPYVAHRQNTCAVNDHWNTTRIKAAYFLHHDEESMINWLVNFGPVNIGMSVIQPMRAYKGGVFTPSEYACKNEVIGLHALLITGYGTSDKGEKYWIVKNSWGNTWGVEHGYIYFARGINACGIEEEPIGILA